MIKRDVQVGVALRLSQNQFLLTDASRPTGTRSAFAITEFEDLTVQDAAKCLTGRTLAVSTLGYGAAHMTATDDTLESLELLRPATADNDLESRIREFAGNKLTFDIVASLFPKWQLKDELDEDHPDYLVRQAVNELVEHLEGAIRLKGAGQMGFRQRVMAYTDDEDHKEEFRLTKNIVAKATNALYLFAVFSRNLYVLVTSGSEGLGPELQEDMKRCISFDEKLATFSNAPGVRFLLDFLFDVFEQTDAYSLHGLLNGLYRSASLCRCTEMWQTSPITRSGYATFLES